MPDDVKNDGAAPSAARDVLTAETKLAWNAGKDIEQPTTEAPASSDAPKQTAKPEHAAEPGAAKEDTQDKGSRRKPAAEERIAELIAENKRLKEEKAKPAETKTEAAPVKAEPPKAVEAPKKPVRPKLKDFDSLEAYEAATDKYDEDLDKYHQDLSTFNTNKAIAEREQQRALEAVQREFNKYLAEAQERYPNLKEVLPPFTKELESAHPYVQSMLNATDNVADVLMVICGDEAQKAEFLTEAKGNPAKAIKRIAVIESAVKEELAKGKAAKVEAKEPEKKDKPAEPVTRAPKPVSEVGGRATNSEDSGTAAARSGDFRTAKSEWNREYLATNK